VNPFSRNVLRDALFGFACIGVGYAFGVVAATFAMGIGAVLLVLWSWLDSRRIDWVLLGGGAVTVVFGLVAVLGDNPAIVKYRSTFSSAALALLICVLLVLRVRFYQRFVGALYELRDDDWRSIDLATLAYLSARGTLNWWVATNLSDESWLWYSTFGSKAIGFAFAFSVMLWVEKRAVARHSAAGLLPPRERWPQWMQRALPPEDDTSSNEPPGR
jgi:intracellular septation protein A